METNELLNVADKVKELFNQGKNDNAIAGELNLSTQQVVSVRTLLNLYRRQWINVFEKFRRVHKDESAEQFKIMFAIPYDKAKEIGLRWGNDYQFTASCSKGEIKLEFMERMEE